MHKTHGPNVPNPIWLGDSLFPRNEDASTMIIVVAEQQLRCSFQANLNKNYENYEKKVP